MAMYIPAPDTHATQHDHTEHLAVRNTRWRRWLTLLAHRTTRHLYRRHGSCHPLSSTLLVKTGPAVHLTEAATLQLLAAKTSIPVPRVHCAFVHANRAYIVMDRIRHDGHYAWRDERASAQLRGMLRELRALEPPDQGVQSCTGGSLRDARISRSRPRFGPFATVQDFHSWLRDDLQPADYPERVQDDEWREIQNMVARQDGPWSAPVFSHADLTRANILVRHGRIVGIVNWASAGWYPAYWEYTAARTGARMDPEWCAVVDRVLEEHPEALEMEAIRQKWWGKV